MLNRDDRLLLHNTSGEDVVIEGYDDEPYARVLADGTVEVNTDSQAYHLNEDRFAKVDVPAGVDSEGAPRWKEVSRTGRFEWHDHRAHWMAAGTPPQVDDESVRTKVFDWSVPLGRRRRARRDRRHAVLDAAASPAAPRSVLIFGVAGALIAGCIVVIVVRRRRSEASEPAAAAW